MISSDNRKQRREYTLQAHRLLLKLDEDDFQGVVRFSYKRGCGLQSYVVEEHGQFNGKEVASQVSVKTVCISH